MSANIRIINRDQKPDGKYEISNSLEIGVLVCELQMSDDDFLRTGDFDVNWNGQKPIKKEKNISFKSDATFIVPAMNFCVPST